MKTSAKKVLAVVMGIALVGYAISFATAGSSSAALQNTGFLGDYYKNLKPGPGKDDPKFMWIKPGTDFTKYKKVMVDYVVFALAEDAEYKGIDANVAKQIGDNASLALINAMQDVQFPVVSEPGPDVLRVRTAIINLKPSKPGLSTVTSVIPVGLAFSLLHKGTKGSFTGAGATDAEMMVLDSMTNEVLACGQDHKDAKFDERFSKWGSVKEAFESFGGRLAQRVVYFTTKKK